MGADSIVRRIPYLDLVLVKAAYDKDTVLQKYVHNSVQFRNIQGIRREGHTAAITDKKRRDKFGPYASQRSASLVYDIPFHHRLFKKGGPCRSVVFPGKCGYVISLHKAGCRDGYGQRLSLRIEHGNIIRIVMLRVRCNDGFYELRIQIGHFGKRGTEAAVAYVMLVYICRAWIRSGIKNEPCRIRP